MGNTRQVMEWSVQQPCSFRGGENWFLPRETSNQLRDISLVSSAIKNNYIIQGICVTGSTTAKDGSGAIHELPIHGFWVDERLNRFSGLQNIKTVCGQCEANTPNPYGEILAGCHGYLDILPDSQELEDELWKLIRERGLEERLRSQFQVTTPLWYGFWVESPLKASQVEFLIELLELVWDRNDPANADVAHFLNALATALRLRFNVHVTIAPLGHADLDYFTVFPHCPRCKAAASVDRWQTTYEDQNYACEVCRYVFNPNDHHSCNPDSFSSESKELKDIIGEQSVQEFTKKFLMNRGCTAQQADEVIDNENHGPVIRQISEILQRRASTTQSIRLKGRVNETSNPQPTTMRLPLGENVNIDFVLVPTGKFLMGAIEDDDQRVLPLHEVEIAAPFYIAKYPITQAQWIAVMGPASYHHEHADLPVDQVNWFDCQSFCQELCNRSNRIIRLPSEAEWEYACRASTTTRYACGETITPEDANYKLLKPQRPQFESFESEVDAVYAIERDIEENEGKAISNKPKMTRVGSYPPNAWGIYDMHGNVSEWCADAWHENYEGAPTDGRSWDDLPLEHPNRVIRGGSCSETERTCTSAYRSYQQADQGRYLETGCSDERDRASIQVLIDMIESMRSPQGFRVVCEL